MVYVCQYVARPRGYEGGKKNKLNGFTYTRIRITQIRDYYTDEKVLRASRRKTITYPNSKQLMRTRVLYIV